MCEMTDVMEHPEKWECLTCGHEWERTTEAEAPDAPRIVKDAHGTVLNDGDALKAARGWAEKIAALPPTPVRMAKAAINGAATALHRATSFMDLDQFALAATTNDHAEAIAAFLERRAPTFRGD